MDACALSFQSKSQCLTPFRIAMAANYKLSGFHSWHWGAFKNQGVDYQRDLGLPFLTTAFFLWPWCDRRHWEIGTRRVSHWHVLTAFCLRQFEGNIGASVWSLEVDERPDNKLTSNPLHHLSCRARGCSPKLASLGCVKFHVGGTRHPLPLAAAWHHDSKRQR